MTDRLWEKPYLTPEEVGELLGLSERTVRRHLKAGTIPSIKIGRAVRISRADLDQALRKGLQPARPGSRKRPGA